MNQLRKHFNTRLGLLIILLYLGLNLVSINDYGVTWDFTYHFNAGLWHLKKTLTDSNFLMGPSPPLSDIMPTLGYLFLFEKLKLLPWDSAYNFYSVFLGSIGVGILYFAIKDILNWQTAFFSSLTLALLPRYFGHLHNNMKDIPQAVFFALTLWLFYRFQKSLKVRYLFLGSLSFSFALLSKFNAIFISIVISFWYFLPLKNFPKKEVLRKFLFL